MLPEVEKYFAARDARNSSDYWDRRSQAEQDNPVPAWSPLLPKEERAAYYVAAEKREAALRQVDNDWKEAEAAAFDALRESENAMVRWIATTPPVLNGYEHHAHTVLRALPMTREEIETFGDEQGWCGEYGRFLRLAEKAGVLPEQAPDLADIEPLVDALRDWYGGGADNTFRKIIRKQLPALIESARERAAVQQ
ncbi:hypothetical protein ACIBCT_35265 [Streptosporangium sp. NPDC050855]|uniref:hypothetical protein n=1 Tax=Streptosporangium sp. NPDC050855 TaxID=3366194 RepID=UPI0037A2CECC